MIISKFTELCESILNENGTVVVSRETTALMINSQPELNKQIDNLFTLFRRVCKQKIKKDIPKSITKDIKTEISQKIKNNSKFDQIKNLNIDLYDMVENGIMITFTVLGKKCSAYYVDETEE